MKGYRFYAEMPEARKSKSASKGQIPWTVSALKKQAAMRHITQSANAPCCIAVYLDDFDRPCYTNGGYLEGLSVAIDGNHHSYATNGMSREYLAKRCVRISESLARTLSPQLFARLDD